MILMNISDFITVNKDRVYYDYGNEQSYLNVSLTNIHNNDTFEAPIYLIVSSISHPDVTIANPDGYIEGLPYFDYSNFLGDGKLDPDETSSNVILRFNNPSRLRFSFTTEVKKKICQ